MRQVSLGKFRALNRASSADGHFNVLALDHTDALKRALNPASPQEVSNDKIIAYKRQVVSALVPETSAVLLDPIYGAPQAIRNRNLGNVGLLVELEKADYQLKSMPLEVEILPGWSVAKIKQMGADGVKLFFYYNPDAPELTAKQDHLLRAVVADCAAHDIPLYAEPILCEIGEDESVYIENYTRRVIDSARRIAAAGADILKLEYPVHPTQIVEEARCRDACAQLSASVDIPWVLLSAGVSFEVFLQQVEIACASGASGCIVGRAVWGEAAQIADERDRQSWLDQVGRERMRELASCVRAGSPWTNRVECEPVSTDWYRTYGDT
ncbi:MAG: tagatose 1,6-diphosphate aldolase, partial [Chloroflexota bacterium]